ncbi:DUF3570 domain-containing protein [Crenothrix polyspora]|uniref:DUF3570 domain-containing protein n=1 Tax=Crenothrix polyspora TaxID=360316 RepID=A0A1R4H978_9GAMM|nr:DUF3570 domain-containing protein [Crenothrix polyspora]SJM92581.1 conserved hypothetical protein [Crenothrix polyspora]
MEIVRKAVDVAVTRLSITKTKSVRSTSASLQALTAAALALPGLIAPPVFAADEEVSFQYSHYQEGKRQLFDSKSTLNPIEVDSLQGSAKIKLADRIRFAFNYTQDTWSGATPITTAPLARNGNRWKGETINTGASPLIQATPGVFDKNFNPLKTDNPGDPSANVIGKDTRLAHTLSYASPETRKQGDFKLSYDFDNAALDIGGGISIENDYESRFGNLAGRWDFNKKHTSVSAGVSYTNSHTQALLDHAAYDYYHYKPFPFKDQIQNTSDGGHTLSGDREDWATHVGLTQIINKHALINIGLGYTYSSGFMENPYKAVTFIFVDPNSDNQHRLDKNLNGNYAALFEQRPNERNQWTPSLSYVQHIAPLDAALHVDYRFSSDDWGINAHTFELTWGQPLGDGWTITPKFRYYSQSAADFYQPVFLSKQGLPGSHALGADGLDTAKKYNALNPRSLPSNYSSDQRLSGYGALSGGVTLSKQFAKGVNFEVGFEYYSHAGALKLDGGGEGAYADFNYYMANAGMKVNLDSLATSLGESNHHAKHHQHTTHQHAAPAGVMFDHVLHNAGDVMVGYRYMYSDQSGNILHGNSIAKDSAIIQHGCANNTCSSAPSYMTMHMHMLDLMFAPSDWLTLMLMPQFVDMNMSTRELNGAPEDPNAHSHSGGHNTGGVGDTGLYAISNLFNKQGHQINLSLGISAPTGDVGIKLRDTHGLGGLFIHYGMQLGSGTWDFKPALTYTGALNNWSWGAQASGTKRLESKNASGFAFGDIFQATAWSGYNLTPWLSASVRGVYTVQGKVKGEFNNAHFGDSAEERPWGGSQDYTGNYGGRFWDVGFGLSAVVPNGDLQGNRLSFEWLQPVEDDVNGYQVERDGALSASWNYMF